MSAPTAALPVAPTRTMNGRLVLALMFGVMIVLFGLANLYVFSQEWRQRERLVADGLLDPTGVVWMPGNSLVAAEAGGRLTWVSIGEATRATLVREVSNPVALARGPNGDLLVLTGPCGGSLCQALLAPDAAGNLSVAARLDPAVEPAGLAATPDGGVYVADAAGGRILRVDRARSLAEPFAQLPAGARPRGLAVGPDGTLHATLSGSGSIVRLGADGVAVGAADGFAEPIALGFEPAGTMLVLEAAGRLVRAEGRVEITRDLAGARALSMASDGRAYVTVAEADGHGRLLQVRRLGPIAPRRMV